MYMKSLTMVQFNLESDISSIFFKLFLCILFRFNVMFVFIYLETKGRTINDLGGAVG